MLAMTLSSISEDSRPPPSVTVRVDNLKLQRHFRSAMGKSLKKRGSPAAFRDQNPTLLSSPQRTMNFTVT